MKWLLLLLLALPAMGAPGVLRTNAMLRWTYPTNELSTNLTFYIYSHTNISVPLTNWPVLTNVVGTNLSVAFPINAQQRWFFMTASNWWAESLPSEVVGTPPLPRNDSKLELGP